MGEVGTVAELEALRQRFNVQHVVIDALPEQRLVAEFMQGDPANIWQARYDRHDAACHKLEWGLPRTIHLNRVRAIDETFARFRSRDAILPPQGRELGGRIKNGFGDYYRQMLAPQRTLEEDARGNLVAKWVNNGKADHYAHAEVYCWAADYIADRSHSGVIFPGSWQRFD